MRLAYFKLELPRVRLNRSNPRDYVVEKLQTLICEVSCLGSELCHAFADENLKENNEDHEEEAIDSLHSHKPINQGKVHNRNEGLDKQLYHVVVPKVKYDEVRTACIDDLALRHSERLRSLLLQGTQAERERLLVEEATESFSDLHE